MHVSEGAKVVETGVSEGDLLVCGEGRARGESLAAGCEGESGIERGVGAIDL